MGVMHGVDENKRPISIERREYLKHQSDRKYIRNMDRQNADSRSTTSITVATPQRESIDNLTMNRQNGGKFERMDDSSPTTPESSDKSDEDGLFQQMFFDCMNAYNRVCMREKKKKSSPAACTKALQWSTY